MKVILARTAGFCMGVRRAMNAVIDATHRSTEGIYTLGPLVHNDQAVEMLNTRNVRVVSDPSEVKAGSLFIRAHGITPEVRRSCNADGVAVCDMTCPHVARAQKIVARYSRQGFATIIAGDRNHAEVIGLLGHGEGRGHVVSEADEVDALPPLEKVCLVAQTTQSAARFERIEAAVKALYPDAVVRNTICSATEDRQNEVRALSKQVDAMIVVGGQHSANTVRLAEIARSAGIPTFHIETEDELRAEAIRDFKSIGVTAGASTPQWVFQAVVERIIDISQTRSALRRLLYFPFRIGVHTYLYLGAGSAAMAYVALRFLQIDPRPSYLLLAFLYVVSMHILNRFTDRAAAEINNPLRMKDFTRLAPLLLTFSIAAALGALVLASTFGLLPALLMGGSLVAGIGYNVRIFPGKIGEALRFTKVREIPGSKDLGSAAAWATVTVLLPSLAEKGVTALPVAGAFLFVFLIVFVRFLIFDVKDIEGDRLVGNETLPLIFGKTATGWLLVGSFTLLAILIVAYGLSGRQSPHFAALGVTAAYSAVCAFFHYKKASLSRGIRFELIVDAQFIIIGFLAWLL